MSSRAASASTQLASSSRLIEGLIQQRKMEIVGAVLDLATGSVNFIE